MNKQKKETQTEFKKKSSRGRKKLEFNMNEVEIFGKFRATQQTMADHFGCNLRTISREISNKNSEFCRTYKKGNAYAKLTLFEAQFQNATQNNNAALQIWLGKQLLGQSDKQEIKQDIKSQTGVLIAHKPASIEDFEKYARASEKDLQRKRKEFDIN